MLRTFGDYEHASEETGCTDARVVGAARYQCHHGVLCDEQMTANSEQTSR